MPVSPTSSSRRYTTRATNSTMLEKFVSMMALGLAEESAVAERLELDEHCGRNAQKNEADGMAIGRLVSRATTATENVSMPKKMIRSARARRGMISSRSARRAQPRAHATCATRVGVDGRQLGELAAVDDRPDLGAEERVAEAGVQQDAHDSTTVRRSRAARCRSGRRRLERGARRTAGAPARRACPARPAPR